MFQFKNVEDVNNADLDSLVLFVREEGYINANQVIDKDLINSKLEADKVVATVNGVIEGVAFAIRDRVADILEEGGDDEQMDEFMNSLADATDQTYNGDYEYRPDSFWTPSTC